MKEIRIPKGWRLEIVNSYGVIQDSIDIGESSLEGWKKGAPYVYDSLSASIKRRKAKPYAGNLSNRWKK